VAVMVLVRLPMRVWSVVVGTRSWPGPAVPEVPTQSPSGEKTPAITPGKPPLARTAPVDPATAARYQRVLDDVRADMPVLDMSTDDSADEEADEAGSVVPGVDPAHPVNRAVTDTIANQRNRIDAGMTAW
jgi:hypothetical protein